MKAQRKSGHDHRQYGCPTCGSTDIQEINECIALLDVTEWSEEGEPETFGEPDYGDLETVDEPGRYSCRDCRLANPPREDRFDEPARLD